MNDRETAIFYLESNLTLARVRACRAAADLEREQNTASLLEARLEEVRAGAPLWELDEVRK